MSQFFLCQNCVKCLNPEKKRNTVLLEEAKMGKHSFIFINRKISVEVCVYCMYVRVRYSVRDQVPRIFEEISDFECIFIPQMITEIKKPIILKAIL